MGPEINFRVTEISGLAYAVAANGENRGASANASNFTVPTAAGAASTEDAKRPHLRLVRD